MALFKMITNAALLWSIGTLCSVVWEPGQDAGLGENGHMCVHA